LFAELLVTVDEHDECVLSFERPRIQACANVRDRQAIFAVGRKRMPEADAAARPRRHAGDIGRLIRRRWREISRRDFRFRLAHGEMSHGACDVDELLDERR